MSKCNDCKHFVRQPWFPDMEPQHGGTCELLLAVLKMNNSSLVFVERLYVNEAFGCVLCQEKEAKCEA